MDTKNKAIFLTLWFILASELIGLLLLMYFARLPYFVALFVAFIKVLSPWLIIINIAFLLYTLFSGRIEFTLTSWKDYLKESFRFFIISSIIALILIVVSATLGTAFGVSAERISRLPTIKAMREWVSQNFYEYQEPDHDSSLPNSPKPIR